MKSPAPTTSGQLIQGVNRKALIAGGVFILYLFIFSQLYVWIRWWNLRFTLSEALLWSLPDLFAWTVIIPLVVHVTRRFPVRSDNIVPRVVIHAVSAVIVSISVMAFLYFSDALLDWSTLLGAPGTLLSDPHRRYGVSFHTGIMIYGATVAITESVAYYSRFRERDLSASRLETQLVRSRLDALKAQLDPHFLFNTLNSISVLMRRDPDSAERMITNLSMLLRRSFSSSEGHMVTLEEELGFLQHYLDIQRIRFGDRLKFELDTTEVDLSMPVPGLLLQPIVENCIKYGYPHPDSCLKVSVRVRDVSDGIEIRISDSGPGFDVSAASSGVGTGHTKSRLKMLYPNGHRFEVDSKPGTGTVVRIWLATPDRSSA